MGKESSVKVLDKTIDILMLFLDRQEPLGISEISKDLKLYKSSVHRILTTLMARGFIRQNPENRKYWLGSQFYSLGMLYKNKLRLRDVARPYLEELADQFGESVHLAIYDELDYRKVVLIDKVETSHRLRIAPTVGSRNPTHASACGKVMLANSDEEIVDTVLMFPLERFTETTITNQEEFRQELKIIRENGYARDNGELESGLTCYAAPIINDCGEVVAGISVSGPESRLGSRKEDIIEQVKVAARQISYELR